MINELLEGNISQDDYMYYHNITTLEEVLPKRVYGFVYRYKDINYIIINKNISTNKKRHTLLHEFAHIELNHIDKKKRLLEFRIEGLEDEADNFLKELGVYYGE